MCKITDPEYFPLPFFFFLNADYKQIYTTFRKGNAAGKVTEWHIGDELWRRRRRRAVGFPHHHALPTMLLSEPSRQLCWEHGHDGHRDHRWKGPQGWLQQAEGIAVPKGASRSRQPSHHQSQQCCPYRDPRHFTTAFLSLPAQKQRGGSMIPLLPGWTRLVTHPGWVAQSLPLKLPAAATTSSTCKFLSTFFSLWISTLFSLWD